MRIIGLTGEKSSGKSTLARHICQKHGWRHLQFAHPLKSACASLLEIPLSKFLSFTDVQKEEKIINAKISYRELLQQMGTELARNKVSKTFFIDSLRKRLLADATRDVVISDVRFENEAKLIVKEFKGELWRVRRPDSISKDRHSSECGFGDNLLSFTILNDKTIASFLAKCDEVGEFSTPFEQYAPLKVYDNDQ